MAAVLAGLRRYQSAPIAPPRASYPVVARSGAVALRDVGPGTGRPLLVVPSLINPPHVLDLAPGNSLLGYLAAQGHRPLLVDWGPPETGASLAALVETRLLPLLDAIGEPVAMLGYCLGGTLALAAAALAAPGRVTRLALLAAPWHFAGYDDTARAALADWWRGAEPLAIPLGAVPMDLLQPAFWGLDPEGLVAKYARFATMADGPEAEAFVRLEDWSNAGHPLSLTAMHDLAVGFHGHDLPGTGQWQVGGSGVDPAALAMPLLDIVARRDRIVPAAAAVSARGIGTGLTLDAGHVGMIVGRQAPALLWAPLGQWLLEGQPQRSGY